MSDDVVHMLLGLVVLLAFAFARPERATCPAGYYVEGIRPSGSTLCRRSETGGPDCAGAAACPDIEIDRHPIPLQIYCTGGSTPIVVDARTVGCTRRFGS